MRPISYIYLFYWLLIPLAVSGQAADTLYLPELRITDVRLGRPDSLMSYRIDRIQMGAVHAGLTLGDALQRSGSLIRGYGPGVLQTVAFRGFAASQTQVLWNGWALNHGMVGVTDLSLYPSFLLGDVVVNRAGGSAEYGNAAIGGIIELQAYGKPETVLHSGVGSSGNLSFGAKSAFEQNGWAMTLGVFRRSADNDYLYSDVFRFPITERKRENAATDLTSLMISLRKEERDRVQHTSVWLTQADSEIPGPISAGTSRATQKDQIMKQSFGFSNRLGRGWAGVDATISGQSLNYLDPGTDTDSRSTVASGGLRLYWVVPGVRVQTELRGTHVTFTEYDPPARYETSLSTTVVRGGASGSVRIDHDSFYGAFWSGSVGYRATHVRAHLARSFGTPTFNDLYWPLLGNPDLSPETAVKAEIGLLGELFSVELDVPVFAARITDGIQWIPQRDGRVRPMNLRDVTSIGAEPSLLHRAAWFGIGVDTKIEGVYTRSRYTKARFAGDQSVNKRVAYVPEWQALTETSLTWNGWIVMPRYRYTGERFTTEDERFPMPAVGLWELSAGYTHVWPRFSTTLLWRIDNALDANYTLIRWYPMPGRQHTINLQLTF